VRRLPSGRLMASQQDTGRRLEAVADQLEALRAERDRLVVQRRAEGASLAVIAREAGLTRQGVNDLLRRLGQR